MQADAVCQTKANPILHLWCRSPFFLSCFLYLRYMAHCSPFVILSGAMNFTAFSNMSN